jgi:hypothetical protein
MLPNTSTVSARELSSIAPRQRMSNTHAIVISKSKPRAKRTPTFSSITRRCHRTHVRTATIIDRTRIVRTPLPLLRPHLQVHGPCSKTLHKRHCIRTSVLLSTIDSIRAPITPIKIVTMNGERERVIRNREHTSVLTVQIRRFNFIVISVRLCFKLNYIKFYL